MRLYPNRTTCIHTAAWLVVVAGTAGTVAAMYHTEDRAWPLPVSLALILSGALAVYFGICSLFAPPPAEEALREAREKVVHGLEEWSFRLNDATHEVTVYLSPQKVQALIEGASGYALSAIGGVVYDDEYAWHVNKLMPMPEDDGGGVDHRRKILIAAARALHTMANLVREGKAHVQSVPELNDLPKAVK